MKKLINLSIVIILLSTAIFTGCSNMTDMGSTNQDSNNFLTLIPADNSLNIGINDVISIQFEAKVDKKTIEANFVLISQSDLADSICPISNHMGHSDMNKDMMDTTLMNHLKHYHHTSGTFQWNSDYTKCTFKSDYSLKPNCDYMMYINPDMMNHMKSVMTNNGMMSGGMNMGGGMNMMGGTKPSDLKFKVTRFRTRSN